MSNLLKIMAVFFACLALLPLTAFLSKAVTSGVTGSTVAVESQIPVSGWEYSSTTAVPSQTSEPPTSSASLADLLSTLYPDIGISESRPEYYKLLLESGEIVELPVADYLRGVVAAEMPLEYEDEALKAQIIAAHTYALNFKAKNSEDPDPSLKGADLTDSPDQGQAYISDAVLAKRYPNNTQEQIKRLNGLIAEVQHLILLYEGEPIVATYHAVSAGKTESAKNIWGAYSPYLISVDSTGDTTSPDYNSVQTLTETEVKKILTGEGVQLSSKPSEWFSSLLRSEASYVAAANICGTTLDGRKLRSLFSLRSTCFEVSYSKGVFTFTVKGWGHGAGMSQYGAQYMAQHGSGYLDILEWYYKGVTLGEL